MRPMREQFRRMVGHILSLSLKIPVLSGFRLAAVTWDSPDAWSRPTEWCSSVRLGMMA